jgi:hypothetical protein
MFGSSAEADTYAEGGCKSPAVQLTTRQPLSLLTNAAILCGQPLQNFTLHILPCIRGPGFCGTVSPHLSCKCLRKAIISVIEFSTRGDRLRPFIVDTTSEGRLKEYIATPDRDSAVHGVGVAHSPVQT